MSKSTDFQLKTFSIHETNLHIVSLFKELVLDYKHLENILNILIEEQFKNKNNQILNLLLNKIIMKAVLKNNTGGDKTKHSIATVNEFFQNNDLFKQAKDVSIKLNDKNISMIVSRLRKDWSNFFLSLKNKNYNASYPKAKKLSRVYSYSVPLERDKFSLSKDGFLGITLGNKMIYTRLYKKGQKPVYLHKPINNVTVVLSHDHIHYAISYKTDKKSEALPHIFEQNIDSNYITKVAGGDIGINNIFSLYVNDLNTQSLIISGKELISYNCNFNKRVSNLAEQLALCVTKYEEKEIKIKFNDSDGNFTEKTVIKKYPIEYNNLGKKLVYRRSQLFERRRLFMDDYIHKLSKKIVQYLKFNKVDQLVISRNLSFTKTDGSIKQAKKSKQKFYQIPFGMLLNKIEEKCFGQMIPVIDINEAYTSKTSSISADINAVLNKKKQNQELVPTDFNGSRGIKKKGKLNNPLGRGLFKDNVINKIINSDINGACNHIKVAIEDISINRSLWKYCNPKKIKSNHEFDKLLKAYQIVDIQTA